MNIKKLSKIISELPKNSRILDAGCGDGRISRMIRNMRNDLDFYGIDLNFEFGKKTPDFVKFSAQDVKKTNFRKDFFDIIICFHVIEHLEKPRQAIDEFRRILKKGGKLIIEVPHKISCYVPKSIGYNFYQDKTHKKAYDRKAISDLVRGFDALSIKMDNSIHNYFSKSNAFRSILNACGLNKTVIWAYASKR